MTLASFFCRLINGRCRKETREPEREPYQKTNQCPPLRGLRPKLGSLRVLRTKRVKRLSVCVYDLEAAFQRLNGSFGEGTSPSRITLGQSTGA